MAKTYYKEIEIHRGMKIANFSSDELYNIIWWALEACAMYMGASYNIGIL